MVGIYKIECVENNTIYIGQTNNIKKRWNEHKLMLKRTNHYNSKLQRTCDKYGYDSLMFSVVEECKENQLNEKETYWYNYYGNLIGFNKMINLGGTGNAHNVSEETKKKMSESLKGRIGGFVGGHHTQEAKDKISEHMKINNPMYNKENVIKSISHRRSYKGSGNPMYNKKHSYKSIELNKLHNMNIHKGINHPSHKTVLQFDLQHNLIKEWQCMNDIKRELCYNISAISRCCNGKGKTYKNSIWEFKIKSFNKEETNND